ncbi:MAG: ABC transporter permease [Chitinophagaceae bacterium]
MLEVTQSGRYYYHIVQQQHMLTNHFKIAWRNFTRSRFSSFINVSGLAVGMAVAILIGLWIADELSFNKYHKNYDRIVKVMDHRGRDGQQFSNYYLQVPLGAELKSRFGDDFKYVTVVRKAEEHVVAAGDKKFTQPGNYMDQEAPDMLTLDMIDGSRKGLSHPNSILLSETLSKKLFGNSNALDKVVRIDNETDVKVTGVYKDLPVNSEFRTTAFILPFELYGADKNDWHNYNILVYAQLNPNADIDKVSAKIKNIVTEKVGQGNGTHELFLHPMSKWHLYSNFENHVAVTSDQLKFIWFYGIIGAFVLLLACINFMNLSTARSEKRAKEVGIRKAIGSLRKQLVVQFYAESLLIAFFSFIASLFIVQIVLPWFNKVADKDITILWSNPLFWLCGIVFTLITGLLAGSYPALYLSSFNPVRVLKGTFRTGRASTAPRKILVVMQFSISIALIIGTAFVYMQIQHAKDRTTGYEKNGLITMYMNTPDFATKYEVLKKELMNTGAVVNVARANYPLTNTLGSNGGFYWHEKAPPEGQYFNTIRVDQAYGETVGWDLIQGRNFDKNLVTDSSSIILNESAVKVAGLINPVGERVKWQPDADEGKYYTVIGVVKDMVKDSPFQNTEPSVIFLGRGNWLFAKMNSSIRMHEALPKIEAAFKQVFSSIPFDYKFADEEYALKFAEEERVSNLSAFFATLAIFISCLGLFGLASFVAEQRIKELGIRKILGASAFSIWRLLSRDFTILVMISCFIAIPIAWYFLSKWLNNYVYRIQLSWWVFAAAGAGALLIAIVVVSFQAIKAALANPVKALRSE